MILKGLDNIGVSVVIITLNGKDRLIPTLEHLSNQKNVYFDWEVLIIDNKSTDNTSEICKKFWNSTQRPCELRIIKESIPGQAQARKNGILNSKYRYMLYVDDDNWLVPDYIYNAYSLISKDQNIAAIGGKGFLEFEPGFKLPTWFDETIFRLGSGAQGKNNGDTTNDKGCLYTAGAIFDRVWLSKLFSSGFQPVLKGRDGKSLTGGEDRELTIALKLLGGRLYYYDCLQFLHFMPSSRISWKYLLRLSKGMGQNSHLLKPYNQGKHHNNIYEYSLTFLLIIKYFILASFTGFKEGNENIVILNKFFGKWKAIALGKETELIIAKNIENINQYSIED